MRLAWFRSTLPMLACGAVIAAFAPAATLHAQSAAVQAPPMNPLSVEPRVPRLGVTPCVVELFQDVGTGYFAEPENEPEFAYAPPPGCPWPWAKVILSVDFSGPGTTHIANITIGLGDASHNPAIATRLFVGGAQFNAGQPRWRVERDITEYAALLRTPRPGFARDTDGYYRDPNREDGARASGRMIFYPATTAQAVAQTPQLVLPLTQGAAQLENLPRNIERAYLDVYAQQPPFWFTCVPDNAAASWPLLVQTPLAPGDNDGTYEPDSQGCSGSAYKDVVVLLDGQAVGTAPLYPWLNSDINIRFHRSVDVPVPTPQSINLMPFRFDLSPFAALLSNGSVHILEVQYGDVGGSFRGSYTTAALLLHLDAGSSQVTGAVLRNSLQGAALQASTEQNDWTVDGSTLIGQVARSYRRAWEIAGYVNTSHGRVDTTVQQEQVFSNAQDVRLLGYDNYPSHTYEQRAKLVSLTERTVLRQQGSTVLAFDRDRYHYPLNLFLRATGGTGPGGLNDSFLTSAQASVEQGDHRTSSHVRPAGAYASRVYANFAGGRRLLAVGSYSQWQGARSHYFNDNLGSCFRERVTWQAGALTAHTQGVGCPDGINRVRGFAHPDGSPDDLGWLR